MTDARSARGKRRRRRARGSVRVGVLAVLLAIAAGCGRHPGNPTGPAPSTAAPPGATLAIAGTLFDGSDREQIRAYLRTVKEIKPIRFDVEWSPATVAVSKDEAMRALLGVSRDGSTFRFARAEPVVARIKRGSILWIYDLALARVESVDASSDVVVVHASPASLTQAFTRADIEFDAQPHLQDLYVAFRPHHARAPASPAASAAPHPARFVPSTFQRTPHLVPAVWYGHAEPTPLRVADTPPPASSAPPSADDPDGDYGETRPAGDALKGELMGFEYSMAYATAPDHLSLQLQARKKEDDDADASEEGIEEKEQEARDAETELHKQLEELADLKGRQLTAETALNDTESEYNREMMKLTTGIADPTDRARAQQAATQQYQRQRGKLQDELVAIDKTRDAVNKIKQHDEERLKQLAEIGGHLKKLFDIVSDNLDVRFRVKADVDSFGVAGALKVINGNLDSAALQFKNLKGRIHVDFIGRMGQPGNGAVKVPVVGLPYVFNIPFPMAGFPLVIQLGSDFSVNVFLAGKHATQRFSGDYAFSGSEGIQATRSGTTDQTAMSGEIPEVSKTEAMSPGVSGLVLAVQAPRVGVGIGAFGASSVAYVDVVSVVTMTNAAAANGAAMLSPLCQRTNYSAVGSVGIDTHIMPVPIPFAEKLNKKLSTRKQVFEHHREVLNPPVKGCEV